MRSLSRIALAGVLMAGLFGLAQGTASAQGRVPAGNPVPTTSFDVEVVDASGAPLPGVSVAAIGPGGRQFNATTDAQGRLRLPALPPGTYQIELSAPGFTSAQRTVRVGVGQASSLRVTLTGPVPVGVPPPPVAAPGTLDVTQVSASSDLALQALLTARGADGWALMSAIPVARTRTVFVSRKQPGASPCLGQIVPEPFSAVSLKARLALVPTRRFAGVHLLSATSYAIVLCDN